MNTVKNLKSVLTALTMVLVVLVAFSARAEDPALAPDTKKKTDMEAIGPGQPCEICERMRHQEEVGCMLTDTVEYCNQFKPRGNPTVTDPTDRGTKQ